MNFELIKGAVLAILIAGCAPGVDDLMARANASLEAGDTRAAEIDIKKLLQSQPDNVAARALLARVYVGRGEVDAAAIEIDKARVAKAPRKLILFPECAVLAAKQSYEQVLAECAADAGEPGDKVGLQLIRGKSLLALARTQEAKELFQTVAREHPANLQALIGLADSTATLEGVAAARAVLDGAPEAMRKTPAYWLAVASVAMEANDLVAAETALQRAADRAREQKMPDQVTQALASVVGLQLRLGATDKAAASVEELQKLAPNNAVVMRLRGQVAVAQGRLEDARSLLEAALTIRSDDLPARMMLGAVNFQQGKFGQAEMHFASVVSQQPDNVTAKIALQESRAALAAEKADQAKTSAAKSPQKPESAAARIMQQAGLSVAGPLPASRDVDVASVVKRVSNQLLAGDLASASAGLRADSRVAAEYREAIDLLRAGDQERASDLVLANLQKAPRGSDTEVAAANFAGATLVLAGKVPLARQQFERAVALAPKDILSNLNLARVDLIERKNSDAERRFRQVLAAQPDNMQARLGVGVALRAQGKTQEADTWLTKAGNDFAGSVDAQLALAQLYMVASEPSKALAAVDRASKIAPGDAKVANARGTVLLANRDVPAALASFERAASLAPQERTYALNVVRAHLVNNDPDGALRSLDALLKSDPRYTPALVTAAAVSLRAARAERAAGYVAELRKQLPSSPLTATLEGDLAFLQRNYPLALDRYRKAAENGLNASLVQALHRSARLAGAASPEAVLQSWLKSNPKDVAALFLLAEYRQTTGDVPAAIGHYQDLLAVQPNNVAALNNLAFLYQGRDSVRALDLARKAYTLAPAAPEIQDTYGWILVTEGKVDEGLALLKSAIRRMPDNAEVRYHYAVSLARKGNTVEAAAELRKALAGTLSPPAKAEAEKLLQQLSK